MFDTRGSLIIMQPVSQKALQRRIKRRLLGPRHNFFAVCSPGFEKELSEEIESLPEVSDIRSTRGGVAFSGPLDSVYYANLLLNSAHRVLLRVREFAAQSFPMLFDQLKRVDWELWIPNNGAYRLRVTSTHSRLNMKQRILETCAKAIEGKLSSQGILAHYDDASSLEFVLSLFKNRAMVSFNSSGPHLHKRGHKPYSVTAPLRETLACSILLRADYSRYDLIVDPFCGSGTFLLEAARMALGKPAGGSRQFAFIDSLFFNPKKFEGIKVAVRGKDTTSTKFRGFDISPEAVSAAKMNAAHAGLDHLIEIEQRDVFDVNFSALAGNRRLLVTNPPYGQRLKGGPLGTQALDLLIQRLSHWRLAVLATSTINVHSELSKSAVEKIGRREVTSFQNGGIQTFLHIFEIL